MHFYAKTRYAKINLYIFDTISINSLTAQLTCLKFRVCLLRSPTFFCFSDLFVAMVKLLQSNSLAFGSLSLQGPSYRYGSMVLLPLPSSNMYIRLAKRAIVFFFFFFLVNTIQLTIIAVINKVQYKDVVS